MRRVATIGSLLTMLVVLLSPASPAGERKCPSFKPRMSASASGQHDETAKAPLLVITDAATEKRPVTVEYEHGVGLDPGDGYDVLIPDATFFNLQVRSKKKIPSLNLRTEWAAPSPQDVDLFLYDAHGQEVAHSAAFNPVAEIYVHSDDDGNGWEQIRDVRTTKCSGFTVESQGSVTFSLQATLKVWLDARRSSSP